MGFDKSKLFMQQEEMKINLELFEGPLDLLLHLIKKSDLDIHNIPIAPILDQYLEYIHLIEELNIDLAGEFILLASELAHIKSRMLLCDEKALEDEELDPRANLVARLLEYQKFKNAAAFLNQSTLLGRDVFKRPEILLPEEISKAEGFLEIDPFKLLTVFNEILKKVPKNISFQIEPERISITERIYQILDILKESETVLFEALFNGCIVRSQLVITFLALLEMAKLNMVQIFQLEAYGPIRVKRLMSVENQELRNLST